MRLAASMVALTCAIGLTACATNNDDVAYTGDPAPVAAAPAPPPPPAYAPPPPPEPAYTPPPPAPAYTGERG
jgi:hypothetical protein